MNRIVPILKAANGARYPIKYSGVLTIGSGKVDEKNIVINDPSIQFVHAQLTVIDSVKIKPLQGEVFVNGQKIDLITTLQPGDIIRLGQVELEFVHDSPEPIRDLPSIFGFDNSFVVPDTAQQPDRVSDRLLQRELWRQKQLERLDLDWELLQKHWPGWTFYESDRSVIFTRPMATNRGNHYIVRILAGHDYPTDQPELYVTDLPVELPPWNHLYHTLGLNAQGQQICGYKHWSADERSLAGDSLLQAALRLREWLEAFDELLYNPTYTRDIASILD